MVTYGTALLVRSFQIPALNQIEREREGGRGRERMVGRGRARERERERAPTKGQAEWY